MVKKLLYVSAATVMTLILFMIMTAAMGMNEVHAEISPADESLLTFKSTDLNFYRGMDFIGDGPAIAESTDTGVFKVLADHWNPEDNKGMGDVLIVPTGVGTAKIKVKNAYDYEDTWEGTVTVEAGFFQNVLDNSSNMGFGHFESWYETDHHFEPSDTVAYGDAVPVRYPYTAGAKATLLVKGTEIGKGDYYGGDEGDDNVRLIDCPLRKIGTTLTLHVEWAGATHDYTAKIVNGSKIKPKKIKKNSKKAAVVVKDVHKGDYLKIKVGKKFVKTVKIKSSASSKTIKWTNKKKMKKGTKVTYYLYNKYKQKLAKAAKKVG